VATSLVVREDALTLYGFAADDERDVFELVQTATGVGPRLALAMLAVFTPDALRRAVAAEDVTALTRVPGIGRKGAQRIVLELAGRLGAPGMGSGQAQPGAGGSRLPGAAPWRDQVRAGLVNLGWQARDAELAIAAVEADMAQGGSGGPGGDGPGGDEHDRNGAGGNGAGGGAGPEVDVAVMLRAALRKLSRA
jgi:Holliday junction DNA helicase RuvA